MSAEQGLHLDVDRAGGPHRPMRLRIRTTTALVLLCLGSLAAPTLAHADGAAVIRDCGDDGQLSRTYSQQDYADALAHLPADVDEYSDCRDVISRARLSGGSGRRGGGTGGGPAGGAGPGGTGGDGGAGGADGAAAPAAAGADPFAGATAQERAAYAQAVRAGAAPVKLDGRPISPDTLGGANATTLSDVPAALRGVLALLVIAALGAAALTTRRRVLGRRST